MKIPGTDGVYSAIETWKDVNNKVSQTWNDANSAYDRAKDQLSDYIGNTIADLRDKYGDLNSIYSGSPIDLTDFGNDSSNSNTVSSSPDDPRIRIRAMGRDSQILYTGDILGILAETDGVIFPYTPTIGNMTWTANYQAIDVVHNNQEFYGYKNSAAMQLTISGQFTATNYRETRYTFAALHFFRSCTKMRFGTSEPEATRGLPPPVLSLSGLGPQMFNNLPVILNNVSTDFNPNCDMVPVQSEDGSVIAWIPVLQTITVSLTSQQTPNQTREFNYAEYVSGEVISKGGVI